jgi:hypothetical protein
MTGGDRSRIKVFLSYAHRDEEFQKELDEHLGALKRENLIDAWWDHRILPGSDWSEEIARHLEEAKLILLLVSSAFLNSTYCYEEEMRRAIERHEAGTARVVWIYLRPCHWKPAPFAKLQGLPTGMKPIASWTTRNRRDLAWAEVVDRIHLIIAALASETASDVSLPKDAIRPHERKAGIAPRLEEWTIVGSGDEHYLTGIVSGHPKLTDGDAIKTSRLLWISPDEKQARTRNRVYHLGSPGGNQSSN